MLSRARRVSFMLLFRGLRMANVYNLDERYEPNFSISQCLE